jgi:AcrR family transcriptional regulator
MPGTEIATRSTSRPRGRPPGATREQVLNAAIQRYADCVRIDVVSIAAELGVGRASIYRWFGSREGLVNEVLVRTSRDLVAYARRRAEGAGAHRLLSTFGLINRGLARSRALRYFLREEQGFALRLVASGAGKVQPTMVGLIKEILDEEVGAGRYRPPTDTETLAYAIVRLAESFLFNDAVADLRGDVARLREVQAALLGVPATV